jgi:hypothetical protein
MAMPTSAWRIAFKIRNDWQALNNRSFWKLETQLALALKSL